MFGGTHLVNRAGLARTFQNIRLFREMSVVENLLVAQHMRVNRNLLAGILNTPAYRRAESDALDRPSTGWKWWIWWSAPIAWRERCRTAAAASGNCASNVHRAGNDLSG
jgi:ABC-type sugar transport system ATPase subunit